MADDIQVIYERDYLILNCGKDSFIRLRDLVIAEAGGVAVIDGPVDGIRFVDIEVAKAPDQPPWLRDRIALFGCAIVAFPILFVVVVGIFTIAGWMR